MPVPRWLVVVIVVAVVIFVANAVGIIHVSGNLDVGVGR